MGDVRGNLKEVVQHHFKPSYIGETWLKPLEIPWDTLALCLICDNPNLGSHRSRGIHGFIVVRTLRLVKLSNFEEVKRDQEHYLYIVQVPRFGVRWGIFISKNEIGHVYRVCVIEDRSNED